MAQFPAWRSSHRLTGDEFKQRYEDLKRDYRLTDISGCWDGRVDVFTDVWEESDGLGWRVNWGLPLSKYQDTFNDRKEEGFRPARLSFYATPDGVRVCALWLPIDAGPAWEARHGLSRDVYQQEFANLKDKGYRPVDITGYSEDGQARYAAVWEHQPTSPSWEARHHLTFEQYEAEFRALADRGYVLDKVVGYTVGDETLYAALWTQRSVPAWFSASRIDPADYQRTFDDRLHQSCRTTQVAVYAVPGGIRYAAVQVSAWFNYGTLQDVDSLIDAFMTTFSVPGLSLAISKDGRLVFARARGMADTGSPPKPLSVRHRMRVASVSKPITAAAVMLLAQNGSLQLGDRVFGSGAQLGTTYGTTPYTTDEKAITVDHLLTHASGFQNGAADPMFSEPAKAHAALIGWVLDNRDPMTTPGMTYSYLNFGYCVLGRIIEKVSGQTYEAYVRTALLNPAGATSMQIAGDTKAAAATDEVVYYGQGGEDPYGMKVARMDAHGGWIATPIDLLRFLRVVDGRDGNDLLTTATVTTMTTAPAGVVNTSGNPSNYARGYAVTAVDAWDHNGSLPGTLALLRRRPNGVGHAAAINTRQSGDTMMNAFYKLLDDVEAKLGAVPPAPFDLF